MRCKAIKEDTLMSCPGFYPCAYNRITHSHTTGETNKFLLRIRTRASSTSDKGSASRHVQFFGIKTYCCYLKSKANKTKPYNVSSKSMVCVGPLSELTRAMGGRLHNSAFAVLRQRLAVYS